MGHGVVEQESDTVSDIFFEDIFAALGGERRFWHPTHSGLERPASTDHRPDLSNHTEEIGRMGELYLQDAYDMTRIDDGPVDLVLDNECFDSVPVQSKAAVRVASRGDYDSDGGLYLKEPAMHELVGGNYRKSEDKYILPEEPEEALLHALVHQPRTEYSPEDRETLDTPIRPIETKEGEKICDTAIVGELVMPADRAIENAEFDTGNRRACYWHWSDAYQPAKDGSNSIQKPSEWYENSFITERISK